MWRQDIDMSRQEFIDKLPADQKKQLEDLKKANAEAIKTNQVINTLNADLKVVNQDIKDAEGARTQAARIWGQQPLAKPLKPRRTRSGRRSTPRSKP